MNKNALIGTLAGLVAGLVIGFATANYLNKNQAAPESSVPGPSGTGAPAEGQDPAGMMTDVQTTLDDAKNKPDDAEAQLKAGDMFARIQRFDEALSYFKKAAEISPDSIEANTALARVYFEKKDYENAGVYFQKAVGLDEKNADIRSDLGLTYYLREPPDLERAVAEYRKAINLNPRHEATLQNLCVALNDTGQKEELAKTVEMLRKVNPNNPAIEKFGLK